MAKDKLPTKVELKRTLPYINVVIFTHNLTKGKQDLVYVTYMTL